MRFFYEMLTVVYKINLPTTFYIVSVSASREPIAFTSPLLLVWAVIFK